LKSTSFTLDSFPQSFLSTPDLSSPSEIRTFRCYEGTAHKLRPSPFRIHLRSLESITLLPEPNSISKTPTRTLSSMETRSKVKGIPQGIPTTPFVEGISETLPPVQGINLTLHKQQLVEEFPESKFPLPSETTQFHVSTEEPEHPIPVHNPASPKSPKFEPSTSTQADDLVRAIKKLGKMKSDAGKLREPEPFTGKDPKKLKAFIFQCQLYFRNSDLDSDSKKVTFALSYLQDVAQEWFKPGISGLTDEPPKWFDNWEAFLDELRTNFGPYDKIGDAEHELTNLRMRDGQRASDYLVRCSWGEPALRYRFYKGLPPRIKDELSKSEKPRTLQVLKQKVQNIDARYWE
jgi:hypothetical protein